MHTLKILTDEASLHKTFRHSTPEVVLAADDPDYLDDDADVDSGSDSLFDTNSLFDEPMLDSPDDLLSGFEPATYEEPPRPTGLVPARRTAPPVPGLYFDPFTPLPDELAESLLQKCIGTFFHDNNANQVMLFERVVSDEGASSSLRQNTSLSSGSSLPSFLKDLLAVLSDNLRASLSPAIHELLFPSAHAPPRARQVIINFYNPGEGITPHVDLLDRFGDGIFGVSLGSGCVMRFAKARSGTGSERPVADSLDKGDDESSTWDVFLPHGSVYVMSGDARYGWTHGIDGRREDWVQESVGSDTGRWVMRSIRVSITFRWLLPGADVVGGLAAATL